jgi:Fur family peroxide stress response transcriptional regulator
MSPADKRQRVDDFFLAHRQAGLPVTTRRRAVLDAILHRVDHPTADQLYRAVRGALPQISRMTVHRILGTFVSLGLVTKQHSTQRKDQPS